MRKEGYAESTIESTGNDLGTWQNIATWKTLNQSSAMWLILTMETASKKQLDKRKWTKMWTTGVSTQETFLRACPLGNSDCIDCSGHSNDPI